jgi:hypothetical protein
MLNWDIINNLLNPPDRCSERNIRHRPNIHSKSQATMKFEWLYFDGQVSSKRNETFILSIQLAQKRCEMWDDVARRQSTLISMSLPAMPMILLWAQIKHGASEKMTLSQSVVVSEKPYVETLIMCQQLDDNQLTKFESISPFGESILPFCMRKIHELKERIKINTIPIVMMIWREQSHGSHSGALLMIWWLNLHHSSKDKFESELDHNHRFARLAWT